MEDEMNRKPDVDDVFSQLEAGLVIVDRVKQREPQKSYFRKVTTNVRRLMLDGKEFQVVLTEIEEDDDKDCK